MLSPLWAPDSQHFLVQFGDEIHVFDSSGTAGPTLFGRQPFWLDSSTIEAYNPNQYPPADSGTDGFGQFYSVRGQSVDLTTASVQQVDLPCCYPLSNGHGAFAVTRYLDETTGVKWPRFVIWRSGQATTERDGEPLSWNASGAELALLHPTEPGEAPRGSLEVVSWPDMKTLYSNRSHDNPEEANFDPSGRYVAYSRNATNAAGELNLEIDIVDLVGGSIATVPIVGDPTQDSEGYVWNSASQILTFTDAKPVVSTHDVDGTKVDEMNVLPKTYLIASQDGTTLVSFQVDLNGGRSTNLVAYRDGASAPLNVPGEASDVAISPDGTRIVVAAGMPGAETAYVAEVLI